MSEKRNYSNFGDGMKQEQAFLLLSGLQWVYWMVLAYKFTTYGGRASANGQYTNCHQTTSKYGRTSSISKRTTSISERADAKLAKRHK
ncbi:unnamed protein product [Camellia sinensis]